jgi:hypothetical protein
MSVLITLFGCWLAFNAVLFATLYFGRSNPKLRAKLFNWVSAARKGVCAACTITASEHNGRAGATGQVSLSVI